MIHWTCFEATTCSDFMDDLLISSINELGAHPGNYNSTGKHLRCITAHQCVDGSSDCLFACWKHTKMIFMTKKINIGQFIPEPCKNDISDCLKNQDGLSKKVRSYINNLFCYQGICQTLQRNNS